MAGVFAEMLPYLLGAVAVALLGAVLPAFWCPSAHARAHIQHFAGGIVTAAVAVEILPEVVNEAERPGWILGAFALGGAFMLTLKWFDHWFERRARKTGAPGVGLALAATLDTLVDGLVVGVGFVAGSGAGALLAVGLGIEVLFLALSVGAEFREGGVPRGKAVVYALPIPLALGVGAVGGVLMLAGASTTLLLGILSFGAAALLYLVVEELVLHAGPRGHDLQTTAVFFLGFLVIFAFRLLGHH